MNIKASSCCLSGGTERVRTDKETIAADSWQSVICLPPPLVAYAT